jgi:hypothetical protein
MRWLCKSFCHVKTGHPYHGFRRTHTNGATPYGRNERWYLLSLWPLCSVLLGQTWSGGRRCRVRRDAADPRSLPLLHDRGTPARRRAVSASADEEEQTPIDLNPIGPRGFSQHEGKSERESFRTGGAVRPHHGWHSAIIRTTSGTRLPVRRRLRWKFVPAPHGQRCGSLRALLE